MKTKICVVKLNTKHLASSLKTSVRGPQIQRERIFLEPSGDSDLVFPGGHSCQCQNGDNESIT